METTQVTQQPIHRVGLTMWHWIVGAVLFVAGAAVSGNAWMDLIKIGFRDEESSHVLLVPLVVAWIVWVRKGRLRQCRPRGQWVGTIAIGLGWFLWSYGYRGQYQSLWHIGAVMMAVGGLLTAVGADILRRFLPAFVALVFLIPVPGRVRQVIAGPMQTATASATQSVAEVVGIDIQRYGNLLTVNGQEVAIAEACNGMRMVFTLFLACYLFTFITALRGYVRVIILVLTPLTAIVCNVIRLVPTVWMYGNYSADAASMFHDISGWVMLVLAFLGLTGIVRVLRWAMVPVSPFTLATGRN